VFDNISDLGSFGGAPSSESDSEDESLNLSSSMEDNNDVVNHISDNYSDDVIGTTDHCCSALHW
jgi:hypothetical protein